MILLETPPPGAYNLWKGLSIIPKHGDWSLIKEHIFEVICGGKESRYKWVLAWLARIVQDPGGKRPGTAIVLRGKQGTGKGLFVNLIGQILGKHFLQIAQANQVTGRFNHHLKDVLLLFVDEGFWAGDKQAEGVLKNMITEPFITVEQKGKDIIKVKNNVSLIIASNNDWVVPAGLEERRFFVLDVSDKYQQNHGYFKEIIDQIKAGGLEAMLYDLLDMDISGVNLRSFEQTIGLFEQKLFSMTTIQKYWFERLTDGQLKSSQHYDLAQYSEDGCEVGWDSGIDTDVQYKDYLAFSDGLHDKYPLCETQFGIALSKMCRNIKKVRYRRNGGRFNKRIFPPLEECREEFSRLLKVDIEWAKDEKEEDVF